MKKAFNPDRLSDLIRTAIGNRTQKSFAEDIGIDTSHLSRIIHCRFPYPPRKATLIQIANNSEGRVTEQMLFSACGYETAVQAKSKSAHTLPESSIRKFMEATILSFLNSTDLPWSTVREPGNLYDLVIQMGDDTKMIWGFVFLIPDASGSIVEAFNKAITSLAFTIDPIGNKISLVTDQPDDFSRYADKTAHLLNADVSFILTDLNNLLITRETWLSRSQPLKTYMEKFNMLKD